MKTQSNSSIFTLPRLSIPISSATGIILCIVCFTTYYVYFQPSISSLIFVALVDIAMNLIFVKINTPLTFKYYKYSKFYFDEFDDKSLSCLDQNQKVAALEEMINFPRHRAYHVTAISYIKGIPASLLMIFFWDHPERSNLSQAVQIFIVQSSLFVFFTSCCYIETHDYLTRKIRNMSSKYKEWEQVFELVKIPDQKKELFISFFSTMFCLFFLYGGINIYLTSSLEVPRDFLTQLITTNYLLMFTVIFHTSFVYLRYITDGLNSLFEALDKMDLTKHYKVPLHTSEYIAKFQLKYNLLVSRLNKQQVEIDHWVEESSEKARFQGIGEISKKIITDISSSLGTLNFVAEETVQSQKFSPAHMKHFLNTTNSLNTIVESLKTQLENNPAAKSVTPLKQSIDAAKEHLEIKYEFDGFSSIDIQIDPKCSDFSISVPRIDLVQIFLKLLDCSIENLIMSKTEQPYISIHLNPRSTKQDTSLILSISNNGSKLSKSDFLDLINDPSTRTKQGYSLNLINSKLRLNGGKIDIINSHSGTVFEMTLPQAPDVVETMGENVSPITQRKGPLKGPNLSV